VLSCGIKCFICLKLCVHFVMKRHRISFCVGHEPKAASDAEPSACPPRDRRPAPRTRGPCLAAPQQRSFGPAAAFGCAGGKGTRVSPSVGAACGVPAGRAAPGPLPDGRGVGGGGRADFAPLQ